MHLATVASVEADSMTVCLRLSLVEVTLHQRAVCRIIKGKSKGRKEKGKKNEIYRPPKSQIKFSMG